MHFRIKNTEVLTDCKTETDTMKSTNKILCLVNLPNGTTFGIQCDPKAIGQKCLEEVSKYSFFGHILSELAKKNTIIWMSWNIEPPQSFTDSKNVIGFSSS